MPQAAPAWPDAAAGWLVAALLALASMVSQFDDTVVNLTVEPLKRAFALDATHFGLLQGVAFGILYTRVRASPSGGSLIFINAV